MPACPVCETENPVNVVECARCGKVLRNASAVPGFAPAIDGLEPTLQEPADAAVEPLAGLEPTFVSSRGIRVAEERLPVERTPHESNGAPVNWVPGELELESGREPGVRERTTAPANGTSCPWCGAESRSAVCDACGRQRPRYDAAEAEKPRTDDIVLCPACLARVPPGIRCVECGVPLPPRDR
jgi:hypothetical protein